MPPSGKEKAVHIVRFPDGDIWILDQEIGSDEALIQELEEILEFNPWAKKKTGGVFFIP